MNFEEFKEDIVDLGAQALDRGNGHWQVKVGPVTINYYPNSARKTIFVSAVPGITKAQRHEKADANTVKKLVKDFKEKLAKETSNDTSSSTV